MLFSLKTQIVIKTCLADVNVFKNNENTSSFATFAMSLKDFLLTIICDKHFLVYADNCTVDFELEFIGEVMVKQEGMFATIATITNFLI